jgi:hypothetical protein
MPGDDTDREVIYRVRGEDRKGVYDPDPDRNLNKLATERELQEYEDYFKYDVCFSS